MNRASPADASQATNASGSSIALMVLAMGCMAAMDTANKLLVDTIDVWQILFLRHAFLALCCVVWLGPRRIAGVLGASARPGLQLVRVGAVLIEMWLFMVAVRHLPLADAHAVLAAAPLIATALAWPILGERCGVRRWLAVGVGFGGILMIIRPGFAVFEPVVLLPLAGAFLWALFQLLTRLTARTDGAATSFVYLVAMGCVVPGLLMPWLWKTPETTAQWLLLLAACIAGGIGHLLLMLALRRAAASTLQPFNYTLFVWATLWGVLVFGDIPDGFTLTGAAIVVGSGLYVWQRERSGSALPSAAAAGGLGRRP